MKRRYFLQGASALIAASPFRTAWAAPSRALVYLGTRAKDDQKGIYLSIFDFASGNLGPVSRVSDIEWPTGLLVSADKRILYSTSEIDSDGKGNGKLAAFAIDRHTGALKMVNDVLAAAGPTYMALDATGKTLLVAFYGSGRTNSYRVQPDGGIGEQISSMQHTGSGPSPRQMSPHAHEVVLSSDNRFVLAPDLGADRVFVFRFDAAKGTLSPNDPPFIQMPAGTGPRHMAFHPNGKFAYLLSELVASVTVFGWEAEGGKLSVIQTISAVASGDTSKPSGAEIAVDHAGRFLYTSTRHDSAIETWAIDKTKGTLTAAQRVPSGGMSPWGFVLDPTGRNMLVMNQVSNSVNAFRVDSHAGGLEPVGTAISVPNPICAAVVPE